MNRPTSEPTQVRACVCSTDGQTRPVRIAERVDKALLKPGVNVYLDSKGAVLLDVTGGLPETGQVAKFHRMLDNTAAAEVLYRDETLVLNASHELAALAAAGQLSHGDQVTFCPQRQVAFKKLPAHADRKHRFIDSSKIVEVIASRDIGNPHWILRRLLFRLHIILHRPDLMQRFRLRPRVGCAFRRSHGRGQDADDPGLPL